MGRNTLAVEGSAYNENNSEATCERVVAARHCYSMIEGSCIDDSPRRDIGPQHLQTKGSAACIRRLVHDVVSCSALMVCCIGWNSPKTFARLASGIAVAVILLLIRYMRSPRGSTVYCLAPTSLSCRAAGSVKRDVATFIPRRR